MKEANIVLEKNKFIVLSWDEMKIRKIWSLINMPANLWDLQVLVMSIIS